MDTVDLWVVRRVDRAFWPRIFALTYRLHAPQLAPSRPPYSLGHRPLRPGLNQPP